jgi:integrase
LNGAVKDGLLASHQLKGMRRARAKKNGRPKTFTPPQVNALQGPAMDAFEREQAELKANGQPYSQVPLRGFCLIGYRTLLRPSSNYRLRWEELDIDCDRREGTFRIDAHKNRDKGVVLEGALAGSVVDYLLGIMPAGRPRGYVHVNPRTGKPFVNIRRAWKRLTEIANSILPEEEQIRPDIDFYNWRHTGASALAAAGADPVLVTKLMGDSSLRTVLAHYFDSSIAHMRSVLLRWEGRD